jgi:hypothetical protein
MKISEPAHQYTSDLVYVAAHLDRGEWSKREIDVIRILNRGN